MIAFKMSLNCCYNLAVVVVFLIFAGITTSRTTNRGSISKFSCQDRPSGYYADVDTGCQVYHMCDGLGRQFSYECPNTTLFQQRMLVCDHWYMVNCSKAEQDYDANLLIGQRDKPFVTEHENHMRTPRPDILSVPLTPEFFKSIKDYKTRFPISAQESNSISGSDETDSSNDDDLNELRYNIPTKWSTRHSDLGKSGTTAKPETQIYNLKTASSTYPKNVITTKKTNKIPPNTIQLSHPGETGHKIRNNHAEFQSLQINETTLTANQQQKPARPSHNFQPPRNTQNQGHNNQHISPTTTIHTVTKLHEETPSSLVRTDQDTVEEISIKFHNKNEEKEEPSVFKFINQFIPVDDFNATARTVDEILSINKQLPDGQLSKEDFADNITQAARINEELTYVNLSSDEEVKKFEEHSTKAPEKKPNNRRVFDVTDENDNEYRVKAPSRLVLPPKTSSSSISTVTKGPPIYYEWKWAVPALDLEPPKASSDNDKAASNQTSRASAVRRNPTTENPKGPVTQRSLDDRTKVGGTTKYKPSDYFIPKFVFPLDKAHPGYDENDSYTSFQVKIPHENEEDEDKLPNYGENSNCPECHPAFVVPGTCKPCVMIRQ